MIRPNKICSSIRQADHYSPVKDGPVNLPGVPLQVVRLLGPPGQELERLAVHLHQSPTMTRVDLVARKGAEFDLHSDFS